MEHHCGGARRRSGRGAGRAVHALRSVLVSAVCLHPPLGRRPDAARDLTQAFLTSLLERRDIEQVRPERGRFRTFLLASVKHFLLNEAARSRAMKRGGGVPPIPLRLRRGRGPLSVRAGRCDDAGNAVRAALGVDGHRAGDRDRPGEVAGHRPRRRVRCAQGESARRGALRRIRRCRAAAGDDRRGGQSGRAPAAPDVSARVAGRRSPRRCRTRRTSTRSSKYLERALARVTFRGGSSDPPARREHDVTRHVRAAGEPLAADAPGGLCASCLLQRRPETSARSIDECGPTDMATMSSAAGRDAGGAGPEAAAGRRSGGRTGSAGCSAAAAWARSTRPSTCQRAGASR